jgi:hypothetical protein
MSAPQSVQEEGRYFRFRFPHNEGRLPQREAGDHAECDDLGLVGRQRPDEADG